MSQYKRNPYGGAKRKFDGKYYDLVFMNRKPTKQNALKAKEHYNEKGYKARIVKGKQDGKTVYRVYVKK